MQRINLQTSQLLTWVQRKVFSRYWELLQDGQVVGTLGWTGTFGSSAAVEFADGRWSLRQPRLFRSDVHIGKEGATENEVVAKIGWRGNGTVSFGDGRSYKWKRAGFFRSRWQVMDQSDQQIFEVTRTNRLFRNEANVLVSPFVSSDPHLTVLIGFVWYLVQIERRHAAVVAATC